MPTPGPLARRTSDARAELPVRRARGGPKGLHAVLSHENSSVADVEEYTKARDVENHTYDCNQILMRVSHFKVCSGLARSGNGPDSQSDGPLKGEPER